MSVRSFLREASAEWHAQVDQAFSGYSFGSADGYRGFLQAHARALFAVEPALERAGIAELLPDWAERRRRSALASDLAALGTEVPMVLNELSIQPDAATLWGMAYVLEGSRLGGRLLARKVSQADWHQGNPPTAYLAHGEEAALWPGFIRQLEVAAEGLDRERLREGARIAFLAFMDGARASRDHQVVV